MDHECERIIGGRAVQDVWVDKNGMLWVGNGEYSSPVNFCPFCGMRGKTMVTRQLVKAHHEAERRVREANRLKYEQPRVQPKSRRMKSFTPRRSVLKYVAPNDPHWMVCRQGLIYDWQARRHRRPNGQFVALPVPHQHEARKAG